jgi:hypothetical protein
MSFLLIYHNRVLIRVAKGNDNCFVLSQSQLMSHKQNGQEQSPPKQSRRQFEGGGYVFQWRGTTGEHNNSNNNNIGLRWHRRKVRARFSAIHLARATSGSIHTEWECYK